MNKVLIIQTAFIGDVILCTSLIETVKANYPNCQIDFLLKRGNEELLINHPFLTNVLVFDKSRKIDSFIDNMRMIRREKYDFVINLQRFLSSGLMAGFSAGQKIIGFRKNPMSFLFDEKLKHEIAKGEHEVDRNLSLIKSHCKLLIRRPKLYPSESDFAKVEKLTEKPFVCIAPASVWKTKQAPIEKWIEIVRLAAKFRIYLVGASSDYEMCNEIIKQSNNHEIENLCGKLKLMETAALFAHAKRVFVNDSGPLHIASAMNTPVTALFCSTIPEFGFGPLSDIYEVFEVKNLECRPCGLHGHKICPKGHFNCGNKLELLKISL